MSAEGRVRDFTVEQVKIGEYGVSVLSVSSYQAIAYLHERYYLGLAPSIIGFSIVAPLCGYRAIVGLVVLAIGQ